MTVQVIEVSTRIAADFQYGSISLDETLHVTEKRGRSLDVDMGIAIRKVLFIGGCDPIALSFSLAELRRCPPQPDRKHFLANILPNRHGYEGFDALVGKLPFVV